MFGVFGTRQSWIKFFSPLVEMAIQTDEHMSQEVGELGVFKYIHIYIYIYIYSLEHFAKCAKSQGKCGAPLDVM